MGKAWEPSNKVIFIYLLSHLSPGPPLRIYSSTSAIFLVTMTHRGLCARSYQKDLTGFQQVSAEAFSLTTRRSVLWDVLYALYLNSPQYAAGSKVWSGGTTRSRKRGVSVSEEIAASSHGSPSSPASTSRRPQSTAPTLPLPSVAMNLGLWHISWSKVSHSHQTVCLSHMAAKHVMCSTRITM
jgi:hypothetical protein